jgi:hypothetical protein
MRLRPPVRALLPSLVVERRLRRVPPAAVQRLAGLAERQSEGRLDRTGGTCTYYGATYFTFPLVEVRAAFAGRTVRTMSAGELARTLAAHPLLRLRLLRIAREDAERRIAAGGERRGGGAEGGPAYAGLAPGTARVTSSVTTERDAVLIEVGLEVPCPSGAAARGRRRGRRESQ